jgi:hypothetical protein
VIGTTLSDRAAVSNEGIKSEKRALSGSVDPRDDAAGDGLGHVCKYDRDRLRLLLEASSRQGRACQDDVGLQTDQLPCERSYPIDVHAEPPKVHPHVAAVGPTQVRKCLRERGVGDPVEIGLVASLSRPGGNLTGATQLNHEVAPEPVVKTMGIVAVAAFAASAPRVLATIMTT